MTASPQPARAAEPLVERAEIVRTEEEVLDPAQRATVLTLTEHTCKWPIGDPGAEGFHFCGHRSFNSLPYCEYHSRIAYQPVNDRRRDRKLVVGA